MANRTTGAPNGPLEISVTLEMLRAGVLAYQQWDSDKEETECLVASIFYSMLDASTFSNSVLKISVRMVVVGDVLIKYAAARISNKIGSIASGR